jgi:hypothetical protein
LGWPVRNASFRTPLPQLLKSQARRVDSLRA